MPSTVNPFKTSNPKSTPLTPNYFGPGDLLPPNKHVKGEVRGIVDVLRENRYEQPYLGLTAQQKSTQVNDPTDLSLGREWLPAKFDNDERRLVSIDMRGMLVERASLCAKGVVVLLGEGPRLYWCHADGDSPVLCRDSIHHPSVSPSIYRPTTSPRPTTTMTITSSTDPNPDTKSVVFPPQVKNFLNVLVANATDAWDVQDLFDLGNLVRNLFEETPIGYTTIKSGDRDIIYFPSAHRKHF